jgi:hypothetical protein
MVIPLIPQGYEIPSIPDEVAAVKQRKIRIYPCHTNRASQLGDPCLRRLVLERTDWDKKVPHDVGLQFIFDEGHIQERAIYADLEAAGISVIKQQVDYQDKALQISGRVDGFITVLKNGHHVKIPIEAKSMSPNIWDLIHDYDDFNLFPWTKKYPGQLQIYMYLSNCELGIMLLKNKSSGHLKQFIVPLDYDYADGLLKKAETINQHVKDGTFPPHTEDLSLCRTESSGGFVNECPFLHVCCPKLDYGPELQILHSDELIECLNIREKAKIGYSLYNKMTKRIKEMVGSRENVLAGDWRVYLKKGKKRSTWAFERVAEPTEVVQKEK